MATDLEKALATGNTGAVELGNKMTEVASGMIDMVKAAQILKTELAAGLSTQGIENFRKELTTVLELLASVNGKVDVTETIRGLSQIKTELDTITKSSEVFNSTLGYIDKTADSVLNSIKDVAEATQDINIDDELSEKMEKLYENFKKSESGVDRFKRAIKMASVDSTKDVNLLESQIESLADKFFETADAGERVGIAKEALDVTKKMTENKTATDELVKSLEAIGKNPLDYSGKLTDMMKELQKEMKDVQNASDPAKINELVEKYKDLAKTKESLEGMEKAIRGIGTALGIALPQLKALEIVMFIAQTVFEWSENSAKVNKQMYEIGANLGHMGDKASEVVGITSSLAWKFRTTDEEVRNVIGGLTKIGAGLGNIGESTEKVLALSKLWSEYTPQAQIAIMGKYMKEFGMNSEQAQNVMIGIVNLANELKGIMPKLDAKEFASQIQDVAVSMRKYGLETSDAIALTATLTKLGIDQARIGELAKGIGTMGLDDPAKTMYMMDNYYAKLRKDEKDYQDLKKLTSKEVDELGKTDRLKHLEEEHGTRMKFLNEYKEAGSNVAKKIGMAHTLEAGELAKAQLAVMDDIFGKLTKGGSLAKTSVEETIGLIRLKAPFIEGLGVAGGEALTRRLQELQAGKPLVKEADETQEAFAKRVGETKKLQETLGKEGGVERVMAELLKEWNSGKLTSISDQNLEKAKTVASETTKMRESVDVIKGILSTWYSISVQGGQEAALKRLRERGEAIESVEQGMSLGLTKESAVSQMAIQERAKKEAVIPESEKGTRRTVDLATEAVFASPILDFFRSKSSIAAREERQVQRQYEAVEIKKQEEEKSKEKETVKSSSLFSTLTPSHATTQQDFLTGMTAELNVKDDGTMRLLLKKTGLLKE